MGPAASRSNLTDQGDVSRKIISQVAPTMDASSSVETIVGFRGVERGWRKTDDGDTWQIQQWSECGSNVFADMHSGFSALQPSKEFEELVSWSHCFWLHSLRFFRSSFRPVPVSDAPLRSLASRSFQVFLMSPALTTSIICSAATSARFCTTPDDFSRLLLGAGGVGVTTEVTAELPTTRPWAWCAG
jgi:hypothetical protein